MKKAVRKTMKLMTEIQKRKIHLIAIRLMRANVVIVLMTMIFKYQVFDISKVKV